MTHTLGAQKQLRAASKELMTQKVAFASRLEEQSGSGRGRQQRMPVLKGV